MVKDISTTKIVLVCKGTMELQMHEKYVFFIPVNILMV